MNRYSLTTTALCPKDASIRNFYEVAIESDSLIWAEAITNVANAYAHVAISQEELTECFAAALNAKVTLVGQHGIVRIESTR